MIKNKRVTLFMFFILVLILITSMIVTTPAKGGEKSIVFAADSWIGTWLAIYLPKVLMEDKLGYKTKVVNLSIAATFAAIASGEATIWVGSWIPNQHRYFDKYFDKIEQLGLSYQGCTQAIYVPKWVYDEKGIRSVNDLHKPGVAKMFDIDNDGKGDMLGCDPGWACAADTDRFIKEYALDKRYVQMVGNQHFLTAAFFGRMKKKEPVLMYQFYPHQMFLEYKVGKDLMALEDPKRFWTSAYVAKFANRKWNRENPKGAALLRQVILTTDDILWNMDYVLKNGDKPDTLEAMAREWIAANKATVDLWLQAIE